MTRFLLRHLLSGGVSAVILAALSAPAAAQDPAPVNYALFFGVNKYRDTISGVPELDFAVPDAKELKEELEKRGWQAVGFYNEDVTRRTIIEELTRLAGTANQQDTVLIYFAGHGVRDRVGRQHTYWLTYPSKLSTLAVESIRLSHLLEYVQDIQSDRKIVLLDHCNSGDVERIGIAGRGGARGPGGEPSLAPAQSRDLFPENEVVLGSGGAGGLVILGSARDEAYEFDEIGHGLFTHGLLQALRSADTDLPDLDGERDGRLSLSEVWTRAQSEMAKVKRDLPAAAEITQTPVEILSGSGLMGWKLFEAAVSPAVNAQSLQAVVNQLEQETDFGSLQNGLALGLTLQAVLNWEGSRSQDLDPAPADQAIVDKLKTIRDLGSRLAWDAKKQMLVLELRQQGLLPDDG